MTIEPSAVRFTIGTKAMPPKQPKPLPIPKLSMAEEAKAVRSRFNRKWGRYAEYPNGNDPNEARRIEADARRARVGAVILALLDQHGPLTAKALWALMHEPEEQIRQAMRRLTKEGKIEMGRRTRDGHIWQRVEAAE